MFCSSMDEERTGINVGRRRRTLWDHMSAIENGRDTLAGLTLDAVLGTDRRQTTPSSALPHNSSQVNRTLLDIIRDEEPHGSSLLGHKDKKSWKAFRERLRLKRAGAAWTSSIHVPTSDIPINNIGRRHHFHNGNHQRSLMSKRNSVRFTTVSTHNPGETTRPEDHSSPNIYAVGDMPPARSFRPQMSRHNSTRWEDEREARGGTRQLAAALAEERQLSAREAVAAQEAAEAAAAATREEDDDDEEEENYDDAIGGGGGSSRAGEPVRMSLMDLLEETDRQMGFEGSRYMVGEDEDDDEEGEDDVDEVENNGGVEHTCCVCMVRHKGSAFIPCGHTFCRLCSRELWAQRGNCPLCNGYILEILDIF